MIPPPFCLSQQSVDAPPSNHSPPASPDFCTCRFSGFGHNFWSQGERSWRAGVLVLASTGPAAPLPLSLLLLIWHGESTFCFIVLCMNWVLCKAALSGSSGFMKRFGASFVNNSQCLMWIIVSAAGFEWTIYKKQLIIFIVTFINDWGNHSYKRFLGYLQVNPSSEWIPVKWMDLRQNPVAVEQALRLT